MSNAPAPPPAQSSGGKGCIYGCLITVAILALLAIIAGVLFYMFAGTIMARAGGGVVRAIVEQSDLTPEDKTALNAEVKLLEDKLISGEVNLEQLGKIVEEIGKSPLMMLGGVMFVDAQYVQKSSLSDEEKAAARRTLERVARGGHDGRITQEQLEALMAAVMETDAQGNKKMKPKLTPEELTAFLDEAKALADGAGIEDEPFTVDIPGEFRKAIDRGLGKAPPLDEARYVPEETQVDPTPPEMPNEDAPPETDTPPENEEATQK